MNWVQVYRDDVIASILALLSPALVATLAGLETASLELNAHLRVQPAHCVYDFIFSRIFRPCLTVDLTSERVTLSPSNDHHITPPNSIASNLWGP